MRRTVILHGPGQGDHFGGEQPKRSLRPAGEQVRGSARAVAVAGAEGPVVVPHGERVARTEAAQEVAPATIPLLRSDLPGQVLDVGRHAPD